MTTTAVKPAQQRRAAVAPVAVCSAAWALARVEGPRLIGHPIFLAGIALSALNTLVLAAGDVGGDYFALLGATLLPLTLATLVVANLAALRDRRGGTLELYGAIAAPAQARTLGHLLALTWPTAVAAALVAGAFIWFGAWDALEVTRDGRSVTPGAADLAQGPLAVAVLGALGVALARWFAHPPVAMFAGVALFFLQMVSTTWNLQERAHWFLPLVNPAQIRGDSAWPCDGDQSWPCIVEGFAAVHWHIVYLAGLVVLLGAVALLRDGRRRCDLLAAATSLVVVIVAGALQLP